MLILVKEQNSSLLKVATSSNGSIEIRLDGIDGALIGTCNVNNTGGLDKWSTINCKVKKAKGVHNLYFVLKVAKANC
jgi:arabinoxylan arabinofuranohydrolase